MNFTWHAMSRTVFVLIALTSVTRSQIAENNQQMATTSKKFMMQGSLCELEETKEKGRCIKASNCFKANEQISQGVQPFVCSYIKHDPVVCCRVHSILEDPPRQESSPLDDTLRKRVCEEYYRIVQELSPEDERSEDQYALPGEFPPLAAVGYMNENGSVRWECTGVLLNEKFVLAAASCARHFQYGDANIVRLGATNLKDDRPQGDTKFVRRIHLRHENATVHYCDDIALIELSQTVHFTPEIYPACLPANTFFRDDVTAVGWGFCEERGDDDFRLRKERVSIYDVSPIECQGIGPQNVHLNDENCKDTFDAALFIENSVKLYTVHGLSSYAQICNTEDENHKNKFTNVGKHVNWIESIVWK